MYISFIVIYCLPFIIPGPSQSAARNSENIVTMLGKLIVVLTLMGFVLVEAKHKEHQTHTIPAHKSHKVMQQNGCRGENIQPLCCQGKDNNCRVYGARLNNENSTTCFCDSSCNELGDCCTDYSEACHGELAQFL